MVLGKMASDMQCWINKHLSMDEKLIIKTDRLLIRPIMVSDVENIWPYVSDPKIPKYMSWDAHTDKRDTKRFLERVQKEREEGRSITWAIFFKNQFCGIISLIAIIHKHRSLIYDRAELAYWVGPKFQKWGIMTEAGECVIDFAFKKMGIHRLIVSHVSQNKASEKLIKKWKFKYIGEEREAFKKNGKWYNHRLYELLESDGPNSINLSP